MNGSPHSDTMLVVYFPAERLLVEADIYSPPNPGQPPAPSYPFVANMVENINRLNLRVDRLVPIHGRIVPYQEAVQAAGQGS